MAGTVIYTIPDCPYCKAARDDLQQRGVSFREIDVSSDPKAREEMVALTGDTLVPVIVEEGQITEGFGGG